MHPCETATQFSFWATVICARAITGRASDVPEVRRGIVSLMQHVRGWESDYPTDKCPRIKRCIESQESRVPPRILVEDPQRKLSRPRSSPPSSLQPRSPLSRVDQRPSILRSQLQNLPSWPTSATFIQLAFAGFSIQFDLLAYWSRQHRSLFQWAMPLWNP